MGELLWGGVGEEVAGKKFENVGLKESPETHNQSFFLSFFFFPICHPSGYRVEYPGDFDPHFLEDA